MDITSTVPELAPADVRRALTGLPRADGYALRVIPLRYRGDKPHLSAWTDFEEGTITIQIPEPFHAFGEIVPYGAIRRPGTGMRFIWLTEGITFRTPREVLRFLYLHEWMHSYGISRPSGRRRVGETACDRFALRNFRRKIVTVDDAEESMRVVRHLEPPRRPRSR